MQQGNMIYVGNGQGQDHEVHVGNHVNQVNGEDRLTPIYWPMGMYEYIRCETAAGYTVLYFRQGMEVRSITSDQYAVLVTNGAVRELGTATVLESCHELSGRRPQFDGLVAKVVDGRQVVQAPCGCRNSTATSKGGPSADGVTTLCARHAPDRGE